MTSIATIIIGRNEGKRLEACFASIPKATMPLIYVDSGSIDGSQELARAFGARVVELSMNDPFTAARARNAGFATLRDGWAVNFVQFIDGDCTLQPGWIDTAVDFLQANPQAAVVCGRLRERFPETSVYNRLCDQEWNTPLGLNSACGGIFMIRADAFAAAGGFDAALIAGEEPELCVRLRAAGWEVWRIDAEMALHDATMARFSQWWRRARRGGHAAAEGSAMHGRRPERHGVAQTRRALAWGVGLPAVAGLGALLTPWALTLLFAWPAQVVRLAIRDGAGRRLIWEWAFFVTLGKIPEAIGVLEYYLRRLVGRRRGLIEYKERASGDE
ncbi:glycosyltransferase family 2 protein [Pararhodobacter sp. SW119]|uniref:glycosyltransferase family 2 protein n=1 Tax=Pararhodobacter sp. SW119 TaxID=2780075 RepID=UPI001ADF2FB5|nr:glycosyltransferase family 2 protein [Pararhodobacter sp. SW119]